MNSITRVCLIVSILGILLLFLLANILEPSLVEISDISSSYLNKEVKINANIVKIYNLQDKNFQILTLSDNSGNITGVSFSKTPLTLNPNKTYEIRGKVQEYNKEIQINIDLIQELRR